MFYTISSKLGHVSKCPIVVNVTQILSCLKLMTAVLLLILITAEVTRLRFARDLWRFTNVLWLIDWLQGVTLYQLCEWLADCPECI